MTYGISSSVKMSKTNCHWLFQGFLPVYFALPNDALFANMYLKTKNTLVMVLVVSINLAIITLGFVRLVKLSVI